MTEPRIALFTGNYNHIRDGVSLTLNRLVRHLENRGIEVRIFGPTIDEPAIKHCGTFHAVPSISMPGRPEYRISVSFPDDVKMHLENFRPNIIHIATPDILGFKALRWGMSKRIPVVSSYHTHFTSYLDYYDLDYLIYWSWKYLKWFYGNCEQIYVPSRSMADLLESHDIHDHLKIWARGVETDTFNPSKRDEAWRDRVGIKKDDIVVTFVSRLVWEKELETFAKAVNSVSERNPRVKAMVVGDGPAREGLEQMLPDAVYTGFIKGDELARAYASSDVFFFPSHTETFGNVTLEAMSSGLPCLVANATGSKTLVEHGVNGCLSEIRNVEEFTEHLELITSNDELRKNMGIASREKALEYRWEHINDTLISYYRELLD